MHRAEELFSRLVKQMAEAEGITEKMKAIEPLLWAGKMNGIRNRDSEVVNSEIIYA